MSDSDTREHLDAKHDRNEEQRIEAIKRWVAYIESTPPETWGPQLNTLVNAQLQSAREPGLSAEHYQRVSDATSDSDPTE